MSRAALFENILQIFCSSNREAVAWSFNFQLPEYGWNDMRSRRSFLLDSVCYHGDVMTILNFNWFNLKILMSGWNLKLTSSCVSFTIYQQCHRDIASDVTPTSLQCHNVHWVPNGGTWYFIRYPPPGADWSLLKTVAMSNVFFNNQQQVFECIWCVSR